MMFWAKFTGLVGNVSVEHQDFTEHCVMAAC